MFKYNEEFSVETPMPASAKKVWDTLAIPGGYTKFHPFVKEHIAKEIGALGVKDEVVYYKGSSYTREMIRFEEGRRYDFRITENGKRPLTASFRFTPIDDNNSLFGVTMTANFMEKLPFPLRWLILELKLKPVFGKYLEHVQKGMAYHMETGKQVKRNQFGAHPDFSPE